MAIELHIHVVGETAAAVMRELREFGAVGSLSTLVSGVASKPPAEPNTPAPPDAVPEPEKANGADTPAPAKAVRGRKATAAPAAKVDRAAILDGLTKLYSKGDEGVRFAITNFRDAQGAERLRDLKDDALPAAAELLIELKTAEAADAP
jgi:hypothetical protein